METRGDESSASASRRVPARRVATGILVVAAACGASDGAEGTPDSSSSTAAPSTAATLAAPPPTVTSLIEVNFAAPLLIGPLIDAAGGGEVPPERVEFHDLIGNDGIDEALAIVESGGTLGDLGAGVFTLIAGQPALVQFIPAAGRVEVRLGLVVAIEGVWAADDPECCPSQLRETSYQWDGARFVAITDQVVPNTDQ